MPEEKEQAVTIQDEAIASNMLTQQHPDPGVLYRGTVVDNVDPEQLGRVKVIIEGITPKRVPPADAKWAWTINVFGGGQVNGERYGAVHPHPIGSKVWILFEPGDNTYNNPVVIGGWYQRDRIPRQVFDRRQENVPRAWGIISPKGHSILEREEDDEEAIELISKGGRKIVISDKVDHEMITLVGKKGGEINIKEGSEGTTLNMMTPKGECITLDEKAGSINIQARENVNIIAKNINYIAKDNYMLMCKNGVVSASTQMIVAGLVQTNIGNIGGLVDVDANIVTTTATSIIDNSVNITSTATASISQTAGATISNTAGALVRISSGGRVTVTATNTSINSAIILLTGNVIQRP